MVFDEIDDEQCGCEVGCGQKRKRFPISCLNGFATSKFALLFLCITSIGQGFLTSGLLSVVISTLEKRFHLRSTETGFVASCYDIASCLCVLLITYFGGKGHKPFWIGWGIFIMGIGSLVFTLPHFIAPVYTFGEEEHNICNSSLVHGKCLSSNLKGYMFFFVFGQLLHGAGGTTLFTLGVTYLDENVSQVQSSLYHGVYYASSVLGPAFGFLLGGQFLTIYTDVTTSVEITQKSPLWVGAWWMGFLIGGVFVILSAIPILLLPRELPGTAHFRMDRETEIHQNTSASGGKQRAAITPRFGDAWRSIVVLLRNPTFLFLTLAGTLDSGLVLGLTTFGPKYLESMFNISPTQAATYFGILAIVAGASGQLIGGLIVTKAKLTVKGILKFCIVCALLTTTTTFIFFITCPDPSFAGSTVPYANENLSLKDYTVSCNMYCQCSLDSYDPVCGDDGVTYYSPCHAGCRSSAPSGEDLPTYADCACIHSNHSMATSGKCNNNICTSLPLFLGIFFFSILGTFLPGTPAIQAILRVVPFSQRSLAIGVKFVILRLLGSIPAPIIFGKVLDMACAVWSSECGDPGACEIYINSQLALRMTGFVTVVKVLSVMFFITAFWVYHPTSQDDLTEETSSYTLSRNLPTTQPMGGGFGDLIRHSFNKDSATISYTPLNEDVNIDF